MNALIPILLVIAACGGDNRSPEENQALRICDAFCDACHEEVTEEAKQQCSETCFYQWAPFGLSHNAEKRDCAMGYLVGRECQTERGCNAPVCGDPFLDLRSCLDLIE